MKRKQFSEEQIIGILKEAEAGAVVTELCRRHGLSSATYYAWKAKFGGLEVSDAKRLRVLEDENGKLKRLLAEAIVDNPVLSLSKGRTISQNGSARRQAEAAAHLQGDTGDERAAGVPTDLGGSQEHALSLVPGG